ncbi:hypothetical protein GCM10009664_74030 [Kitasatospora gansuensis]
MSVSGPAAARRSGRAQDPFTAPVRGADGASGSGRSALGGAGAIGTAAASSATVAEAVPYDRSTPSRGRSVEPPGARTRQRTDSSSARVSSRTAGASSRSKGAPPRSGSYAETCARPFRTPSRWPGATRCTPRYGDPEPTASGDSGQASRAARCPVSSGAPTRSASGSAAVAYAVPPAHGVWNTGSTPARSVSSTVLRGPVRSTTV